MTVQDLQVWAEQRRQETVRRAARFQRVREALSEAELLMRRMSLSKSDVGVAIGVLFQSFEPFNVMDEGVPPVRPVTSVTLGENPGWLVKVEVPDEAGSWLPVWITLADRKPTSAGEDVRGTE